MRTPTPLLVHAAEYKDKSWQNYSLEELGHFVHLLSKRASHRANKDKAMKDMTDAHNYLLMMDAMLQSQWDEIKKGE